MANPLKKAVEALAALSDEQAVVAIEWAKERRENSGDGGAPKKKRKYTKRAKVATHDDRGAATEEPKSEPSTPKNVKRGKGVKVSKRAELPAAPVRSKSGLSGIAGRLRGGSGDDE